MYLFEWGTWQLHLETAEKRKEMEALESPAVLRATKDFYESDLAEENLHLSVSDRPRVRGPTYVFNDTCLELRCGFMEEKRGLITIGTIAILGTFAWIWIGIMSAFLQAVFKHGHSPDILSWSFVIFVTAFCGMPLYFYSKYLFRFTRLEVLTSRHLLVRFNRKTRQVHLHRPQNCGGIVTFPWGATGSTATDPADDVLSHGLRLGLLWHPRRTGLPHMEMAAIGKQGQGGSELRDEWEFIRRYMEEGPESVPRPRLSTHLPSPIQAFSAQFEGVGNFMRNSGGVMQLALILISPAFLIIGIAHWLSLLLCWKPRWPKVIREAGLPGKPVPKLTTLDDYAPHVRERLLANADRWTVKPGQRPEKQPRAARNGKAKTMRKPGGATE